MQRGWRGEVVIAKLHNGPRVMVGSPPRPAREASDAEHGSTTRYLSTTLQSAPSRPQADHRARHAAQRAARRAMLAAQPTVVYPLTLPALLQHILTTQSGTTPTRLVICCTRDAFLLDLAAAVQPQHLRDQAPDKLLQLATPTLHNLFTARHVQVAFCASVQTLLAYLASLEPAAASGELADREGRRASERIFLVNPLALHAAASSLAAQGLSRTFAAAVDMSLRTHAQLVVAECQGGSMQPPVPHDNEDEDERSNPGASHVLGDAEDPWEQEVSILNGSIRKFGDRAWAGRTIKAKRVAARWFHFHKLDDPGL